jgi:glyoxylase-like metal-dependent hydrolase (beta-lactamase superfamily II)
MTKATLSPLTYPHAHHPGEFEAPEIAPGIRWLRLPLPMALDHVNCYALEDTDGWTLVDTGMSSRRSKAIWQALLTVPLQGKPVTRLIVTHHHPDHIGLAGWFQAQGVELVITRTAWLYARMLTLDEQRLPSPEALLFAQRAGLAAEQREAKAQERPFNFSDVVAPMPLGFTRISEGDVINAGGRRWLVRLGQGHAPDHATLWSMDDPVILAGDQLLPTISANISVYPTEPEDDPLTEWLASSRALMAHARDDHFVLPGHKLPYFGLPYRLAEMVADHEAALKRLHSLLATPKLATECFPVLFKRPIGPETFNLALCEAVAHLNCLLTRNAVSRDLSAEGAWLWKAK